MPDSDLDCLRCETRMKEAGHLDFVEGSSLDIPGARFEAALFDAYVCPKCGKVEFFA